MERLYHSCGAAVLHQVRQDGLEYFHDFRHPERLHEVEACLRCGASLAQAMAEGQFTPTAPLGGNEVPA